MLKLSKRLSYFIGNSSPWTKDDKNEWIKKTWYRWDAIKIIRHLRAHGISNNLKHVIYDIINDRHGEQVTEQMCEDIVNWLHGLPEGSLKWGKLM